TSGSCPVGPCLPYGASVTSRARPARTSNPETGRGPEACNGPAAPVQPRAERGSTCLSDVTLAEASALHCIYPTLGTYWPVAEPGHRWLIHKPRGADIRRRA